MRKLLTLCNIIATNTIISISVLVVVAAAPKATPSATKKINRSGIRKQCQIEKKQALTHGQSDYTPINTSP